MRLYLWISNGFKVIFLTFFPVIRNSVQPVSLMSLLSMLLRRRMLRAPLNVWCFISVSEAGSSGWYANTTFVAPSCNYNTASRWTNSGKESRELSRTPSLPSPPLPRPHSDTHTQMSFSIGKQERYGDERARLPPMCPGFDNLTRCYVWVAFIVGFSPCSEG